MDLREWFDALTDNKIRAMKGDPESQVLDCKNIVGEGDMKRNLAVVLSGFGNGQGGICIWGVDARKIQGIDCIDSFPGIPNARQQATRLDELTPTAVSPGVAGVVHRAIAKRGETHGFIATFVPASDAGPHMARYGEDRFYQRIGLSFSRMEQFQIADMFGRRARPVLEVGPVQIAPYEILVQIVNSGRGAARGLFIELGVDGPFYRNGGGVDGNRNEGLPYVGRNIDGTWLHAGDANTLLHPTMHATVGGVWLGFEPAKLISQGIVPKVLKIRYKVGALDIAPRSGVLEVHLREP
ncbi:hypothetical protein QFZ42_003473 [Variovorax paradoxus]|uniref:AlbA family DNA-binding domain-containing protein n=1 Tax=Variovorax paradoxus TaxID=34073 RepID=UPI002792755B|nr:hypothetical protein [Variovorax paradoxus]MDQ0571639.1 hypothetical protein [Variovorax paradoxus]